VALKIGSFQIQSLVTAGSVYVLIVLGGLVSSTGSGLACRDWPLCNGQVIPALTPSVLIEFTHRVWTTVVTVFVFATMIFAWRKYGWPHKITAFATLTFVLVLNQVILGMVTVQSGTEPIVVTAHLALATLVFASALTASVVSLVHTPREVVVK
jgi:cytochrome c oxidase assembly protein subunit 15